jgi:hypothetical protein
LAIAGEAGLDEGRAHENPESADDPNAAPARALPREERDLMIAANNGHILAFDNLSGLPSWLSDALCRLASGGSFAIRQLYTDHDEVLFQAARPAILNGIEDVVCRPDLADRAIFLMLESISDEQRRPEKELWKEFELARPHLLGALLDAVAQGLRSLPRVRLRGLPRMADFALWTAACETAFWPPGTVLSAYDANRQAAVEGVSRLTLWLASCGRSSTSAAHGQEGPRIFCTPVSPQAKMRRIELQAGQEIRAPWLAGCVAARHF